MKHLKQFEELSNSSLQSASTQLRWLGHHKRGSKLYHHSLISEVKDLGTFNLLTFKSNGVGNETKEDYVGTFPYYLYNIEVVTKVDDCVERFRKYASMDASLKFQFIPVDTSNISTYQNDVNQFVKNLFECDIVVIPGDDSGPDSGPIDFSFIDTYIDDRWNVSENYPKVNFRRKAGPSVLGNELLGAFADRRSALKFKNLFSSILKDEVDVPRLKKVSEFFWDVFSELGLDQKWYEQFTHFLDTKGVNGWYRELDELGHYNSLRMVAKD